jgi:hypothetical protein
MSYFKCPVKGCDVLFINHEQVDNHMKEDNHCRACGASNISKHNPIDKEPCEECVDTFSVDEVSRIKAKHLKNST